MDIGLHQGAQGVVDRAMARKRQLAFKGRADHVDIEVPAPIARALMPCLLYTSDAADE